jgi:hypothetical protein
MSEYITLVEAIKLTTSYRLRRSTILDKSVSEETLPICETFAKEHVLDLMNKSGCSGIRAYFGLDDYDQVKLVLVAVNERDEDMYLGVDTLLDKAARCPTNCPPSSPLNT